MVANMWVYSGKYVDVLNITPEDITLKDIAIPLSRLNRFNGHTKHPWTVGDHSLLCLRIYHENKEKIAREYEEGIDPIVELLILTHDASEAYLGDVINPLKHNGEYDFYRELEYKTQIVILEAMGLDGYMLHAMHAEYVKSFDMKALSLECNKFLRNIPKELVQEYDVPFLEYTGHFRHDEQIASIYEENVKRLIKEIGCIPSPMFM